jgi:hypothetical protein
MPVKKFFTGPIDILINYEYIAGVIFSRGIFATAGASVRPDNFSHKNKRGIKYFERIRRYAGRGSYFSFVS